MSVRPSHHARLLLLLPLAALWALAAPPAQADGFRHPHFDDRGTLRWHSGLEAARFEAQREGKLILIEFSREACGNCRRLAERVLPDARLRARLRRDVIGLASDCDHPEPAVLRLFRENMPRGRALPFVALLGPDGRWITGWSGSLSVDDVSHHLALGEDLLLRRRLAARARRRAPAAPLRRPTRSAAHPPRAATEAAPVVVHEVTTAPPGNEGPCVGGACKPPSFAEPCPASALELLMKRRRSPPPCPAAPRAAPERAQRSTPTPTEESAAAIGPHDFVEFPRPQPTVRATVVPQGAAVKAAPKPERAVSKAAPAAVAHAPAPPPKRGES